MKLISADLLPRPLLLTAILVFSAVLATGQIAGGVGDTTSAGYGGKNYISGTVFWPSGEPVNTRMRVRLSSPNAGDVLGSTDETGKFIFSGVGIGVYTVIIDSEPDFRTVRQEVDVNRTVREARNPKDTSPETINSMPEIFTVNIRLENATKSKSKTDKPDIVNAASAGVPKAARDFYQKASELAVAKDYRGAIEQLKLAVAAYPAFVDALNEMGVLYLKLNELDKADEALSSALKIKPDAYEPLINRGITLFRSTRFAEAEPVFRDALKAKAESAVGYYYLGRTLNKLGRNDEAEAAFLSCIKTGADQFKEAHRFLAVIYLGRAAHQRVIDELETYLRLEPTVADAADLRKIIDQCKAALAAVDKDRKPGN